MGKVFVFSRRLDNGERPYAQELTVYARDLMEARRLISAELAIMGGNGRNRNPAWSPEPDFDHQEIELDSSKVLRSLYTRM